MTQTQNTKTLQSSKSTRKPSRSSTVSSGRLIPALIIQSHPHLERVGEMHWMYSLLEGKTSALGRNFPDFQSTHSVIGTPLSDPYLSRSPVHLSLLSNGSIKLDCVSSNIQVIANNHLVGSSIMEFTKEELSSGVVIELSGRITLLLKLLSKKESTNNDHFNMVGISPQIEAVKQQIKRLTNINESVLIRGNTGVGKELVAEAIYNVSKRAGKPFVKVNLAAIPSSLATAELFGTKKGAFTGAEKNRAGFFVAAHEGTLFLDEIGEASTEVQSMLLRVLETGEFYPVGSDVPRKVDVRIIAATDAQLEKMGAENTFKQPLLHRLASYEIHIPPLYERKEDIGLLFLKFMKQQTPEVNQQYLQQNFKPEMPLIPTEMMYHLLNYSWPGNIRQLKNITRQITIDSHGLTQLTMSEQIQKQLSSNEDAINKPEVAKLKPKRRKPNTVSCEELKNALSDNLWEIQATADRLNITRTSIYELMKRYNLKNAAEVSVDEIEKSYHRCKQNVDDMVMDLEISKYALTRRLKELGLEFIP